MTDFDTQTSELIASTSSLLAALPEITDYVRRVLIAAEQKNEPAQVTARGLLDRTTCWLASMGRLDRTDDFQAQVAGFRAMIEITVDLALLCDDPGRNEQIEAWERSAKYKHGASVVRFAEKHSRPSFGTRVDLAQAFVQTNASEVHALRAKFWPTKRDSTRGEHPSRWTGRSLRLDVQAVQARFPGAKLEALYEEQFAYLCWVVHGSGLVVTRRATGATVVPVIGMALACVPQLALHSAEFAQRIFHSFGRQEQREHEQARERWLYRFGGLAYPST